MTRIIKITATSPYAVTVGGETKHICRCGLSKNQPICDTTHNKMFDEEDGKIYLYDEDNNRVEVKIVKSKESTD